jgi:hypothetical protein
MMPTMRLAPLLATLALTACATGHRATPPQDWQPLTKTPDYVLQFDALSARWTDANTLYIKVRSIPTRKAEFAWIENTHAIDCSGKRLANTDEKVFDAAGAVIGHRTSGSPYFETVKHDTELWGFVTQACATFSERR